MAPTDLSRHDLQVFSSTTCPDCHRLKSLFQARGVEYSEVLIDEDRSAAERLEAETGKMGVPYILVDGQHWVRGYHLDQPGRLRETLLWEELEQAING